MGRTVHYVHAWLMKCGNACAASALGHKWTGIVTDWERLDSRVIVVADPVFADLLSRDRQQDQGEALKPEHI